MLVKSSLNRNTVLLLFVFSMLLGAASAQKESVLYSFCTQTNCTDGANPSAGLVFDQKGNLYGTTSYGGAYNSSDCDHDYNHGCGVVFKLDPAGKETVLHSFCAQVNCADGANPYAALIFDQKGNLYGTAWEGGAYNNGCYPGIGCGIVFKITPEGKETVLYNFCAQLYCTDGENPAAGLVFDQKGNLYGTTSNGGIFNGCSDCGAGVVFKLTPKGKETVLHFFCSEWRCIDGRYPSGGLVSDLKGNFYGTAGSGGAYGYGVVFKLTPEGTYTVLYSFCALYNCPDGEYPSGALIFDQKGNLYGTTESGGALGGGTVFKLTLDGRETVLYGFCKQNKCADGAWPGGLIFDQKGNLYGTAAYGGDPTCSNGCGVAFKLTPKGKYRILHSFCAQSNCTDGEYPSAGLVFDEKGNLYGTASQGGVNNSNCGDPFTCGVIFKLTP
jgi:uncharacterized repeat protein (TIGR03803 family)